MTEVWKDIPNYEGLYQISNISNVKSLERYVYHPVGGRKLVRERVLKSNLNNSGYYYVTLSKYGKTNVNKVHQLMAITFLNHKPCGHKIVVDHINNKPTDNRIENLQLITQRENMSKDRKAGTSKYVGVCWGKRNKTWICAISIKGKRKHIGCFKKELDAHNAYQKALRKIKL